MKKLILFGTGKYGMEALNFFGRENISYFADNNKNIQGKQIDNILVIPPEKVKDYESWFVVIKDNFMYRYIYKAE